MSAPINSPAASPVKSLDITFLVANGIGVVLYLILASRGWRLPEQSEIPITGEPMVWSLALPVLTVFFFADIVWGVLILRSKESKRWLWWLVAAMGWLIAIAVDFSHH